MPVKSRLLVVLHDGDPMSEPEMKQPMPYTMVEMHGDLEHCLSSVVVRKGCSMPVKSRQHYLGDLDPQRVLATIIALERAENAAHAAEDELVLVRARETKLRDSLRSIQHYARKERFNINQLTSDPPMNELGMDLWRMAKQTLETP